jgi:hypothetical protein
VRWLTDHRSDGPGPGPSSRQRGEKKWWNISSRYPCGIAALGLGVISLPLGLMTDMATFPSVGALVMGAMALLQRRTASRTQGGVGLALGAVGLALALTVAPAPAPPAEKPSSAGGLEQIHPVTPPSGTDAIF